MKDKNKKVMLFAGFVVLTGSLLTFFVHEYFIAVCLFAAINMIQSYFTNICPACIILDKIEKAQTQEE